MIQTGRASEKIPCYKNTQLPCGLLLKKLKCFEVMWKHF